MVKMKRYEYKQLALIACFIGVGCGPAQQGGPDAGQDMSTGADMPPAPDQGTPPDQGVGRADAGAQDMSMNTPDLSPAQDMAVDMPDMATVDMQLTPDLGDMSAPDMQMPDMIVDMASAPDMPPIAPDMSQDMSIQDMGVVATPLELVRISAGAAHTCGVDRQGAAWCWGEGSSGQLGDGMLTSQPSPVAVSMPAGVTFTEISAGDDHTCALSSSGSIYCWGLAGQGQVGDGGIDWRNLDFTRAVSAPVAIIAPAGVTFGEVSAGGRHTCATSTTGQAYCWGEGRRGALGTGLGGTEIEDEPVAVAQPVGIFFGEIAAGKEHTCASGLNPVNMTYATYCWGENMDGRLGTGSGAMIARAPELVTRTNGGSAFLAPEVGHLHTCSHAVGAMQQLYLYCWGSNSRGQLGNTVAPGGSITRPGDITEIPAPDTFLEVELGEESSCGISSNGKAWCWGSDQHGQLGDGAGVMDVSTPTRVAQPAGTMFRWITVGARHACAIDSLTDIAYCWGSDDSGQLGDGVTMGGAQSPTQVSR